MTDTYHFLCEWCLRPVSVVRDGAGAPEKYCCKKHRSLMYELNRARKEAEG